MQCGLGKGRPRPMGIHAGPWAGSAGSPLSQDPRSVVPNGCGGWWRPCDPVCWLTHPPSLGSVQWAGTVSRAVTPAPRCPPQGWCSVHSTMASRPVSLLSQHVRAVWADSRRKGGRPGCVPTSFPLLSAWRLCCGDWGGGLRQGVLVRQVSPGGVAHAIRGFSMPGCRPPAPTDFFVCSCTYVCMCVLGVRVWYSVHVLDMCMCVYKRVLGPCLGGGVNPGGTLVGLSPSPQFLSSSLSCLYTWL